MGCATGTVKYLLFLANLFFALTGLCLLVVGVIYKINIDKYSNAVPEDFQTVNLAPTLTIAVGSIIFIIAFLGCCGAVRESICMLTAFAVILLAIFIIQVAIGVFAFIKVSNSDGDLQTSIATSLKNLVTKYNTDNTSRETMDLIQETMKCCGSAGPKDYLIVPASCCASNSSSGVCINEYDEGCASVFVEFLQASIRVVGYVVIGTAVVEIASAIFALCLSSSIRNESRRGRY